MVGNVPAQHKIWGGTVQCQLDFEVNAY